MELLQLRYFLEIAQDQNMRKTAERLHIAQPALSRSLKKLEEELGLKLFARQGRGIVLNPQGKYYYEKVHAALEQLDEATALLQEQTTRQKNTINWCNLIPEHYIWFLEYLISENPQMQLNEVALRSTVEAAIGAGEIDFALQYRPATGTDCTSEAVLQDELLLLLPPGHALAERTELSIQQVADEPFVAYYQDIGIPEHLLNLCTRPAYRVSDLMMIVQLVERGQGCALLPSFLWFQLHPKVQFLKAQNRLPAAIPLREPEVRSAIYLITPKSRATERTRSCIDLCRRYFRRETALLKAFRDSGYTVGRPAPETEQP